MKKILAILVSVCVVLAMMPASAFATENPPAKADYTVTIDASSVIYDGNNHTPVIAVSVKNGETSTTLRASTDYDVTWKKGTADATAPFTESGTYTATIRGETENHPNLDETKTFEITKLNLNETVIKYVKSGSEVVAPFTNTSCGGDTPAAKDDSTLQVALGENAVGTGLYAASVAYYGDKKDKVIVEIKPKKGGTENVIGSNLKIYDVATELASNNFKISSCSTVSEYINATETNETTLKSAEYTGAELKPKFYAYYIKDTGSNVIQLTEGVHFDFTYTNNINVGTAIVTAAPKGIYTGTNATNTFSITQRDINKATVTVKDMAKGGDINVTVKDGQTTLVEGTDYALTFKSNGTPCNEQYVKATKGTYAVAVNGYGNYKGTTKEYTFKVIEQLGDTYSITVNEKTGSVIVTYTGSDLTPKVALKIGGAGVTSPYEVRYRNEAGDVSTSVYKAGTYDIIVKVTGGDDKDKEKTFAAAYKITPIVFTTAGTTSRTEINGLQDSYLFTGKAITPAITVTCGGKTLTKDVDYIVAYGNNVNLSGYSYATVTVTGKGNYSGIITEKFKIVDKIIDISTCTIAFTTGKAEAAYTGSGITPKVTVKNSTANGGASLYENTDYKITYKDAAGKSITQLKDTGTYSVIVTGIGKYTGSRTLEYKVKGTDISGYTVTLKASKVKATGAEIKPEIVSVTKGTEKLVSSDYDVSYTTSGGVEVKSIVSTGTYRVVLKGKGKYEGSTYVAFTVEGEKQNITVPYSKYTKKTPKSKDFSLGAKATGDGSGLSYVSSNPAVATVDAAGNVDAIAVGTTVITISTVGDKKSEPASREVTVTVRPSTGKINSVKKMSSKGTMRVYFERVAASEEGILKYQVRYSRNKDFKSGTYKTATYSSSKTEANSNTYRTVKGLKSGSKYYVKVRGYIENADGSRTYGSWSSAESVTVK